MSDFILLPPQHINKIKIKLTHMPVFEKILISEKGSSNPWLKVFDKKRCPLDAFVHPVTIFLFFNAKIAFRVWCIRNVCIVIYLYRVVVSAIAGGSHIYSSTRGKQQICDKMSR
jgi:hypothetical protein